MYMYVHIYLRLSFKTIPRHYVCVRVCACVCVCVHPRLHSHQMVYRCAMCQCITSPKTIPRHCVCVYVCTSVRVSAPPDTPDGLWVSCPQFPHALLSLITVGMCVCAHKCVRVCVCLCVDIHTYIYNFHTPSHISRRPSPLLQRVAALSHCLTSKVHTYSAQGGNELCFKHNIQSIISNVNCAHRFCTWGQCIIFKNEYPIYYI